MSYDHGSFSGRAPTMAAPRAGTATCIYEVVHGRCVVRQEPHMGAKMRTVKSEGARFSCDEMTMNGWVRLTGTQGWLLAHARGLEGAGEVARPVDAPPNVAVGRYHHQGMCCLEVVCPTGAPVRASPGEGAELLATHRAGEYVFAQRQSFDGWVRLAGEPGWVLAFSPKLGEVLRPRQAHTVRGVDLWALSDAWAAARRARGSGLGAGDTEDLKGLEEEAGRLAESDLGEYRRTGEAGALLARGAVTAADLEGSVDWVRQRLFAGSLLQLAPRGGPCQCGALAPGGFALSPRVPPLPAAEEDQHGFQGSWAEFCDDFLPCEVEGRMCKAYPSGIVVDPSSGEPRGIWNPEAQELIPVTLLQHGDSTYMMTPHSVVIDPATLEPIGVLNPDTDEIEPMDVPGGGDAVNIEEPTSEPQPELAEMHRLLEEADKKYDRKLYRVAAKVYGHALEACEKVQALDLEVECGILRKRATCWVRSDKYKDLLADAERLLSYDDADAEALEWRRLAQASLGSDADPSSANPGSSVPRTMRTGGGSSSKVATDVYSID